MAMRRLQDDLKGLRWPSIPIRWPEGAHKMAVRGLRGDAYKTAIPGLQSGLDASEKSWGGQDRSGTSLALMPALGAGRAGGALARA